MSDRVGVMDSGKLVQVGTPEELYDRPANRYVADFVGEANVLDGTVVTRGEAVVRVALNGGSVVLATVDADRVLAADAPICVVVRPERMDIHARSSQDQEPPSSACTLEGTLRSCAFVGSQLRFVVNTPDGQQLTCLRQNRGSAATLEPGSPVILSWLPEESWLMNA